LVLGGILLAASMFVGDGDHDADLGGGDLGDADLGDADGGHQIEGPVHGDLGGIVAVFVSLRFWTFFAFIFGLTGTALDGLGLAAPPVTLGLALGMGAVCGYGATALLRAATRSEVGTVASASDYVGQTGRVLLPIGGEGLGKVRIELQGTTVDVLATSDDEQPLAVGDTALILEMQDTTASVTRMNKAEQED
jgi:membrane protein implicated in regulation of membrane protease activity